MSERNDETTWTADEEYEFGKEERGAVVKLEPATDIDGWVITDRRHTFKRKVATGNLPKRVAHKLTERQEYYWFATVRKQGSQLSLHDPVPQQSW